MYTSSTDLSTHMLTLSPSIKVFNFGLNLFKTKFTVGAPMGGNSSSTIEKREGET